MPGSVIGNLDTAPGSPHRRGEKVVALTFDDGPSAVYTPQILRILTVARAPASFEIIGRQGAAYLGTLRAENAAGMALVNHTWSHVDLALLPARRWPAEVDRTSRLLQGVTGHPAGCLRPPYGQSDPVVDARLRARGLAELYWDVDPSDYLRPGAGVIARRVLAALHPGAIVILHDGGGNRSQTVAALPAIIRGIRAAGYQIVPVCTGSPNPAGRTRPAPATGAGRAPGADQARRDWRPARPGWHLRRCDRGPREPNGPGGGRAPHRLHRRGRCPAPEIPAVAAAGLAAAPVAFPNSFAVGMRSGQGAALVSSTNSSATPT